MNRLILSLGTLMFIAAPGCGWTTYTFVAGDDATDTSADGALSDAGDSASFDAGVDAGIDAADAPGNTVDAGPIVHFGRISVVYFNAGQRSVESAVMVQQPVSTGVAHAEISFTSANGMCTFVHTEFGMFTGMPVIPSVDYGALTISGGTSGSVTLNHVGGVYQAVTNTPSLWHPPTPLMATAPGTGSLSPLSYSLQLTSVVDVVQPTSMIIDRTTPWALTWTASSTLAMIHIHQTASDGSSTSDIYCSPASATQTAMNIGTAVLGHLSAGPALVSAGGGSGTVQTSPGTGPVLLEVQNISWQAIFTVN